MNAHDEIDQARSMRTGDVLGERGIVQAQKVPSADCLRIRVMVRGCA